MLAEVSERPQREQCRSFGIHLRGELIPPKASARINPNFPAPKVPTNEMMGGATFHDWGQYVVKWSSGPDDALKRVSELTRQDVLDAGITRSQALRGWDFYRSVFLRNEGNPSAAAPVQLMEHILNLLD